jgi:flavin reductase (DIM6/NTAB) family NADH-FMN oxidoreductase RutF
VPGAADPVGPFPEGADPDPSDRLRRRILWTMPSGIYLLGSRAGDQRNLMTLNWATQVASDPKLLAVSIEAEAVTHRLVHEGGSFVLNVLNRADRATVRKFSKPVVDDGDPTSLGGLAVRASTSGAPIVEQAAAWLDCRVWQEVPCGSHTLFVGEVIDCGGDLPAGLEVLRMEDTRMNYGG